MITIHNKGKRKIIYPSGWDAEGSPLCKEEKNGKMKPLTDEILAGQHKQVSEDVAKHLKELFPLEIIDINSLSDMQAQFKETPATIRAAGYLSPEEVEVAKKKAVEDALAALKTEDSSELSAMDRSQLIALIEEKGLNIDHAKYKNPVALRNVIASELAAKSAA